MRVISLSLSLLSLVAAQKGSPFRCRDRDPQCETWKGRGECTANHQFMVESCPASCDYCENGGLHPTPSPFQLDLVCKDQLAINPGTYKGGSSDDLPLGCVFRCRDNMTAAICAGVAAAGQCEAKDRAVSKTARFQCAESCGVCKEFNMYAKDAPAYPKAGCREDTESGNAAAHEASCVSWAANGECVKNYGFMSLSCEAACGLCEVGGAVAKTPQQINAPPASKPKGSKKKKKKTVLTEVGANGETAPAEKPAAEEKPKPAAEEKPKPAAEEKPKPAAAAAAKPEKPAAAAEKKEPKAAAAEEEAPKKKKGWAQKAKEAMGAALKGKKKESKDEV